MSKVNDVLLNEHTHHIVSEWGQEVLSASNIGFASDDTTICSKIRLGDGEVLFLESFIYDGMYNYSLSDAYDNCISSGGHDL